MKLAHLAPSFLFFGLILLTSCTDARKEKIDKITSLETKLKQDSLKVRDEVAAYNLQLAYTDFASSFPKDTLAPAYLFKAANLSMSMNWGKSSVDIINKFTETYPDDKRIPEALFYKAFVYDNQLNDDAKAGECYRNFIKRFPSHAFAASAEASIKNLGKTDEELIREFERMNADTSKPAIQ
jgi:outer membrane protein assembly factor BamD (BamD/ComL family)